MAKKSKLIPDLVANLRKRAVQKSDDHRRIGRKGKEWSPQVEAEWLYADHIEELEGRLEAALDVIRVMEVRSADASKRGLELLKKIG